MLIETDYSLIDIVIKKDKDNYIAITTDNRLVLITPTILVKAIKVQPTINAFITSKGIRVKQNFVLMPNEDIFQIINSIKDGNEIIYYKVVSQYGKFGYATKQTIIDKIRTTGIYGAKIHINKNGTPIISYVDYFKQKEKDYQKLLKDTHRRIEKSEPISKIKNPSIAMQIAYDIRTGQVD